MPTTAVLNDQHRNLPLNSSLPSGERIRVCHLSMTLKTGGLERLLVDFARLHNADRFDLCFVALDELGPPADDIRDLGFEVFTMNLQRQGKYHAFRELSALLHTKDIDVLHTHNTYPSFYGSLAARWSRVPCVINTQHGRGCGPGVKSLWQFKIANRLTNRIVGVSNDATELCQDQDRPCARKMVCIWNGIDLERFRFAPPRDELTAISVARLSPEKDYATLLRATQIVLASAPDFRLKLVGDGSERPHLEQLARELGIDKSVEFLGERKDIPELLHTAGFFVSSSKTEGISLTLLEAMAAGLPIVTTHVGGNPEIVVEGVTGRLVPPLNPDAIADGILKTIADRSRWPEMGAAARERVQKHFNIRRMVQSYEELYESCLHARRGR